MLVAWEHSAIAIIVDKLTGGKIDAPHWPGHRFDMVYILTRAPEWRLMQWPQMALAGDSTELFTIKEGEE